MLSSRLTVQKRPDRVLNSSQRSNLSNFRFSSSFILSFTSKCFCSGAIDGRTACMPRKRTQTDNTRYAYIRTKKAPKIGKQGRAGRPVLPLVLFLVPREMRQVHQQERLHTGIIITFIRVCFREIRQAYPPADNCMHVMRRFSINFIYANAILR